MMKQIGGSPVIEAGVSELHAAHVREQLLDDLIAAAGIIERLSWLRLDFDRSVRSRRLTVQDLHASHLALFD